MQETLKFLSSSLIWFLSALISLLLFVLVHRNHVYIDHQTGSKAYFTQRDQTPIKAAGNYGKGGSAYGLWDRVLMGGVGASSNTHLDYQLLICDHSFFSGFFVSGYTGCYKYCNAWCGDSLSPYFRTASTNLRFNGVAFDENGHRALSNRLIIISVGLR